MNRLILAAILFHLGTVLCVDLPYRTFRCLNGTYIDERLICDGKADCVKANDGLDEKFGSCSNNREECGPGKYKCSPISYFINSCNNASTRCNTIPDCLMYDDQPDETNCGDEVEVEGCTLNKGKYLCDDGLRCLDILNTCDGFCNCFDCSDEKIGCLVGDEVHNSSQQACFKTPNGPFCCSEYDDYLCQQCNSKTNCTQKCVQFEKQTKCFCNEQSVGVAGTGNAKCRKSNATVTDDHSEDETIKSSHEACFNNDNGTHCCSKYNSECQECDVDDMCDHKCIKFANQTACICDENYIGIPGTQNAYCFPRYDAAKQKVLVYSTTHAIKAINLFTRANFTVAEITEEECEPFLITGAHNYVYFATVKSFGCSSVSIFRTSLATLKTDEVIKIGNEDLNSLAVDWITNNVYYSTSESLFVCTSGGEFCKNLKSGEIYFINLAPRFGLMFWVSRSEDSQGRSICSLMRSSMDGSNEKLLAIINGPCNAMWTVDESAERIYWFDSNVEEIHSVKFEGNKKTIWPFQLQLFSGTIEFKGTPHSPPDTDLITDTRMEVGTMFENDVFFLNGNLKGIWGLEKGSQVFSKHYPLPKITDSDAIYDVTQTKSIYVYNPALHRTKVANPGPDVCCKVLCLASPSTNTPKENPSTNTSENSLTYRCYRDANSAEVPCSGGVRAATISTGALITAVLACMAGLAVS